MTDAAPACARCDAPAVVHWVRRLTDGEFGEVLRVEEERRAEILSLADPQMPPPVFPPLPAGQDFTRTVYACGLHAITLDGAALIHASTCTAPNEADLPGCDCTPEQTPRDLIDEPSGPELPAHWVAGGV